MKIEINFRKKFSRFLEQNGFLPLKVSNKTWSHLSIEHFSQYPKKEQIKKDRKNIGEKVVKKPGVYLYLSKRGRLLYVGKAKKLRDRVWSHYREAFQSMSGDRKGVWHDFFSQNAGRLELLWRQVKSDRQRRVIEEMLEEVVRSKFDEKYPRGKRRLV